MARFIVPLLFALALDVYGYFAIRALLGERNGVGRTVFTVVWFALPVLFVGYLVAVAAEVEPSLPRALSIPLRAIIFIGYLAKFFAAAFFLIDDLRRVVTAGIRAIGGGAAEYWPDRSRFLTQLGLLAGGLPAAVLTYGIIRNPYRYRVHEVDVPIVGLSPKHEGLRIAQISDIHSGSFFRTDPIRDGIEALNALEPDIACFTGDLVNSRAEEIEPYIDIFSQVSARHGVYSIIGNHDYGDYVQGWDETDKEANWQRLYANHRAMGWDLLLNENRVLDINGAPLAVIGVENWSTIGRFPRTGDLSKALEGAEGVPTKVLLSHDPTHWDGQVTKDFTDVQLQLSGHTHGFQFGVEIPGFRWSPSQYVYEQWAGLYTRGRQHLYVNRGYGFLGYPGRVGILPEVTLLRLVAA